MENKSEFWKVKVNSQNYQIIQGIPMGIFKAFFFFLKQNKNFCFFIESNNSFFILTIVSLGIYFKESLFASLHFLKNKKCFFF